MADTFSNENLKLSTSEKYSNDLYKLTDELNSPVGLSISIIDKEIINFLQSYMFPLNQGINCFNIDGNSPLVAISYLEQLNIQGKTVDAVYMAKKLIAAGAEVDLQNNIKIKIYEDDIQFEEIIGLQEHINSKVKKAKETGKKISGLEGGATALLKASQYGREKMVSVLLRHKADPDIGDNQGATPLFRASQNGQLGVVKQLLSKNADLLIHCNGLSCLFEAIRGKHVDIIRALTQKGALVEMENKILGTAKIMDLVFAENSFLVKTGAFTKEHKNMMAILLKQYAFMIINKLVKMYTDRNDVNHFLHVNLASLSEEPKVQLFFDAIASQVINEYWKIIDCQNDVDGTGINELINEKDLEGNNFLHKLAAREDLDKNGYWGYFFILHKFSLLKKQCVEFNTVIKDDYNGCVGGLSPIHVAVKNNNELFLETLVLFCQGFKIVPKDLNKMVDTPNVGGVTPLMYTPVINALNMAELLLYAGANPSLEDKENNTISLIAMQLKRYNFVELCCKYGASLFCKDNKNMTLLDYALKFKKETVVKNLFGFTDNYGFNAAHLFALSNYCGQLENAGDYRKILVEIVKNRKSANLKSQDETDTTITDEEIKILLNTEDKYGRTPIYYAFFASNFGFITWAVNVIRTTTFDEISLRGFVSEFIGEVPVLPLVILNKVSIEFVQLLLNSGINANELYENDTALHLAIKTVSSALQDNTEISRRIQEHFMEISILLLSVPGIRTDIVNDEGLTPEQINPVFWSRLQAELLNRKTERLTNVCNFSLEDNSLRGENNSLCNISMQKDYNRDANKGPGMP